MLGSRTGSRFKRFFSSCSCGTCLESLPLSFIHLRLFVEVSSWNMSLLPVLQVGLFTSTCKHKLRAWHHSESCLKMCRKINYTWALLLEHFPSTLSNPLTKTQFAWVCVHVCLSDACVNVFGLESFIDQPFWNEDVS